MGSDKQDLWGELDELLDANPKSPVIALLQEQADLLAVKTDGRVEARVEPLAGGTSRLMLRFVLVVPALGGYRYELFRVVQRAIEFPAEVFFNDTVVECIDEPTYRDAVASVLKSGVTRQILGNLLDASRAAVAS